mgnify:CR=1 FL=1
MCGFFGMYSVKAEYRLDGMRMYQYPMCGILVKCAVATARLHKPQRMIKVISIQWTLLRFEPNTVQYFGISPKCAVASATAGGHRHELFISSVCYLYAYALHVTLASAHFHDDSSYWTLLQLYYGSYGGVVTLSTSGGCLMNVGSVQLYRASPEHQPVFPSMDTVTCVWVVWGVVYFLCRSGS